jgi:L-histidine N-alpha-methyltransferase
MLHDVREGLSMRPRQLPSKYFYDERGSQLFEEITRLPEYYPTRAERALLEQCAKRIIDVANPATLVELGAGSSEKTRLLLDEMLRRSPSDRAYVPVDVSADFLASSAAQLRAEYPALQVLPIVADFSTHFTLPAHPSPALHAFLGSTIGNFTPDAAAGIVTSIAERMSPDDYFLLGVDLRKDPETIERAYNDSSGVTAQFNRNMLGVINAGLGSEFDISRFDHNAIYNSLDNRIEMRLVSRGDQRIAVPGFGRLTLADGESILTELSYKYDRLLATSVLERGGLTLRHWFTGDNGVFALALASA